MKRPDRGYEAAERVRGPTLLYLFAQFSSPILVGAVAASRVEDFDGSSFAALPLLLPVAVLVAYASATRRAPHRWVASCSVVALLCVPVLAVALDAFDPDARGLAVAIIVANLVIPIGLAWLAVRVLRSNAGDLVESDMTLPFKFRGTRDATLFVGVDQVRVKVRRGPAGSVDNFSDDVPLSAVQEVRTSTVHGKDKVVVSLGRTVRSPDGPLLVLRVVEDGRGDSDEGTWELPIDDATAAADAIVRRRARGTAARRRR